MGIGPEVIAKALAAPRTRAEADFTVIGDTRALKKAGLDIGLIPVVPVDSAGLDLDKRGPCACSGLASFKAVKLALKLLKKGAVRQAVRLSSSALSKVEGRGLRTFDALVTAPVSKEAWQLAGVRHTGHTDLFRDETGLEPLMAFILGPVKAALVTEHLQIKYISGKIKKELVIAKAILFYHALKRTGIARPRIIITALNPHAGDGGLLGMEEIRVLRPAIEHLRGKGLRVTGPAPTDAAWAAHLKGLSDGILCLYHDQALGPLKILPGADRAVHWTWGLPFIRTSPAHGTAYDIAGRGKADPSGMIEALLFAVRLAMSGDSRQ